MGEKIYAENEGFKGVIAAGVLFEAQCPKCKERFTVGQHPWWTPKCRCGYQWFLEINIYAENDINSIKEAESNESKNI